MGVLDALSHVEGDHEGRVKSQNVWLGNWLDAAID